MASLIISPAQHRLHNHTARRVPLGEVANAANSPARSYTALKRSRDQVEAQETFIADATSQAKRLFTDKIRLQARQSPVKASTRVQDDRVQVKRAGPAPLTSFERKCLASKEAAKPQQKVDRTEKLPLETLEGIRQWQKHYKKAFPAFVFYFEAIPDDVRYKCSKMLRAFGAREEKFFSKDVTHVVTTRPVPTPKDSRSTTEAILERPNLDAPTHARTIDPSLIYRDVDSLVTYGFTPTQDMIAAENAAIKKREAERRKATGQGDILSRAREMGMKVWQLEKLQRIMHTMQEHPEQEHVQMTTQQRRGNMTTAASVREAELARMLRNERLHGPSDRDASAKTSEIVPFKGPYIYVRDMDERTKPILFKEFPKPTHKGDMGDWPQFRAASHGKCPFIAEIIKEEEDEEPTKREVDAKDCKATERSNQQNQGHRRDENAAKNTIYEDESEAEFSDENDECHNAHAKHLTGRGQPLGDISLSCNGQNAAKTTTSKGDVFCPPPARLPRSPVAVNATAVPNVRRTLFCGEPAASGLQPSNITSAIRSQVISSTAAGPGIKAGTSKEVHGLKRKVLEKSVGPAISKNSSRPPQQQRQQQDAKGPLELKLENGRSQARTYAGANRDRLVHIDEESTQSEDEEDVWLADDVRNGTKRSRPRVIRRIAKPGYCENCRDKYEDFDNHIISRKHRKFALAQENWKDLDCLLSQLGRPLKAQSADKF